jgi:hypothetical protein
MEVKKEITVKKYKRKSVEADLKQFCYLQKEHAFIEVCEWENGDGYDITLCEKIISLTRGEIKAIKHLVKKIE